MSDNRTVIAHVVSNGHAWSKHRDEFRDPSYGYTLPENMQRGPTATPNEVTTFIRGVFERSDSLVFNSPPRLPDYPYPTQFIYNEQLNTLVVLNPNSTEHFGSAYRLDGGVQQFRELARNSPGSPRIVSGPNAVNGAIERFENQIFNGPNSAELRATLEQRARIVGADIVDPNARAPAIATDADGPGPAPDDGASPHNVAATAAAATGLSEEAEAILNRETTVGFWADDHGRVTHYLDEASNTVVTISPSGESIHNFSTLEDAENFFGTKMDEALRARGELPDLIRGGHNALADAFQATRHFWPRVGATVADVGTFLGKTAKVLGPLGVFGATAEAAELGMTAHRLEQYGLLPENFVYAYDALLAGHVAQATVDPSLVLGEGAIQLAFDELCDQFDIPHHIREEIEPSSLLEMIFGDGNPSPDPNAAYNDPFFEIYDNLPTEISDDMPPEVQALVELRALILQAEADLETNTDFAVRESIIDRLQSAENMYQEQYDLMLDDGQIEIVQAFMAEQAPVVVAEEPDIAPAADETERVAEYAGQNQSLPSPM